MKRDFYLKFIRPRVTRLHRVFEYIDKFPLLPANLAEDVLVLIRFITHRALLRRNSEYARLNKISKMRVNEFQPFSDLLDLYHRLAPEGRVHEILRRVSKVRLTLITKFILDTLDLIFKGYKESQLWDLDFDIADRIGRQLIELSEIAHGWPDSDEFKTFAEWKNALREHGMNLVRYAQRDEELMPMYLLAQELRKRNQNTEAKIKEREHDALERSIHKGAKTALSFIAKHHGNLWD